MGFGALGFYKRHVGFRAKGSVVRRRDDPSPRRVFRVSSGLRQGLGLRVRVHRTQQSDNWISVSS